MEYKKKITLILGGTSNIGKALIQESDNSNEIIFTYKSSFGLASEIEKNFKSKIIKKYKLNFSNLKSIDSFVFSLKKLKIINKVDTIFFNAAEIQSRKNFFSIKLSEQRKILISNCLNFFYLTQQLLKLFKNNKYLKKIVFISSKASIFGGKYISAYSSSKGFLNTFAQSLNNELDKKDFKIFLFILYKVKTKGLMKSDKNLKNEKILDPNFVAKKIYSFLKNSNKKSIYYKLYK